MYITQRMPSLEERQRDTNQANSTGLVRHMPLALYEPFQFYTSTKNQYRNAIISRLPAAQQAGVLHQCLTVSNEQMMSLKRKQQQQQHQQQQQKRSIYQQWLACGVCAAITLK